VFTATAELLRGCPASCARDPAQDSPDGHGHRWRSLLTTACRCNRRPADLDHRFRSITIGRSIGKAFSAGKALSRLIAQASSRSEAGAPRSNRSPRARSHSPRATRPPAAPRIHRWGGVRVQCIGGRMSGPFHHLPLHHRKEMRLRTKGPDPEGLVAHAAAIGPMDRAQLFERKEHA
jgi:hypothetical protein